MVEFPAEDVEHGPDDAATSLVEDPKPRLTLMSLSTGSTHGSGGIPRSEVVSSAARCALAFQSGVIVGSAARSSSSTVAFEVNRRYGSVVSHRRSLPPDMVKTPWRSSP